MIRERGRGLGLEILPDWTPSKNGRLARFDAVIKVAAGVSIEHSVRLRIRLKGRDEEDVLVESGTEFRGLTGPMWQYVRGGLVDIDRDVSAVDGVLEGCTSVPVLRRNGYRPVTLSAFRDMIGMPGEPLLWWRYYNHTGHSVAIRQLRAKSVLWADGQPFRLSTNYNGPAQLPPGRAVSGLWSSEDLEGLRPGTYRMQFTVGDEESDPLVVQVASEL